MCEAALTNCQRSQQVELYIDDRKFTFQMEHGDLNYSHFHVNLFSQHQQQPTFRSWPLLPVFILIAISEKVTF